MPVLPQLTPVNGLSLRDIITHLGTFYLNVFPKCCILPITHCGVNCWGAIGETTGVNLSETTGVLSVGCIILWYWKRIRDLCGTGRESEKHTWKKNSRNTRGRNILERWHAVIIDEMYIFYIIAPKHKTMTHSIITEHSHATHNSYVFLWFMFCFCWFLLYCSICAACPPITPYHFNIINLDTW